MLIFQGIIFIWDGMDSILDGVFGEFSGGVRSVCLFGTFTFRIDGDWNRVYIPPKMPINYFRFSGKCSKIDAQIPDFGINES